jgi:hypothetical protein
MRRFLRWLGIALAVTAVAAAVVWWTGPHGPIPGGPLAGERIDAPPASWEAAAGRQSVVVESRAGCLPYSTTAMAQVHDGELYLVLPSLFGDGLERRLERDPDLLVELDGRLYAVSTERVTDAATIGAMTPAFLWKFFALRVEPGEVSPRSSAGTVEFSGAEVWIHRVIARRRP